MIATRMRDTAFKRVLRKASPGLQVKIEGPGGSFVLHRKAEKPAVFLAGGIGITPFFEYHPPGGARAIAAPPVPVLLQSAPGRCRVLGPAIGGGQGESEFPPVDEDDIRTEEFSGY